MSSHSVKFLPFCYNEELFFVFTVLHAVCLSKSVKLFMCLNISLIHSKQKFKYFIMKFSCHVKVRCRFIANLRRFLPQVIVWLLQFIKIGVYFNVLVGLAVHTLRFWLHVVVLVLLVIILRIPVTLCLKLSDPTQDSC